MNSNISSEDVSKPEITQFQRILRNYKTVQPLESLKKTILIYYVYHYKDQSQGSQAKNQQTLLCNLHTFAQYILDNSLKVGVKASSDSQKLASYIFSKEEQERSKTFINHKRFNVQEDIRYDLHSFSMNGQRVIVLPIDEKLINLIDKNQRAEIQKQKIQSFEKFFKNIPRTEQKQKQWQMSYFQATRKRAQQTRNLFNVLNQIEDLRENLLDKTEKVSLVGILGHKQKIQNENKSLLSLFEKIVSNNHLKPRLLVFHRRFACEEEDSGSDKEQNKTKLEQLNNFLNQQNCCGVFSYDIKKKFTQRKLTVWDERYFAQKSKVKFLLFSKLRQCESQTLQQCFQYLIKNVNNISKNAIQPLKQIYQIVNQSLRTESSSKKSHNLNLIHKQYKLDSFQLPQTNQLKNNFTKSKVFVQKSKGRVQYGQKQKKADQAINIPPALNNLVFIHCFNIIVQSILEKDKQHKMNTEKRLQNWKDGLQQIFSLIASLFENIKKKKLQNSSFYSNQSSSSSKSLKIQQDKNNLVGLQIYQDIQKYFNFISFIFKYIQRIERVLGESSVFVNELKASFNSLVLKDDRIINFIAQNQRLIKNNQQLIYYDILAYLVKTYKGEIKKDSLQYIECHVLQLKATEIASNYIYDQSRIVQAIQAYSTVARKFHELPQMKNNDLFNLFKIEQKIAKLLNIITFPQKAAEIYMYLKMFEKARKLYKQSSWHLHGDQRAKQLLEWGRQFQRQFQFDFAIEFYREAFQVAIENNLKIEALTSKRKCIVRRRKQQKAEELRIIQKYLTEKDLFQYTEQQKLRNLFQKMQKLKWDEIKQCGVFSQ